MCKVLLYEEIKWERKVILNASHDNKDSRWGKQISALYHLPREKILSKWDKACLSEEQISWWQWPRLDSKQKPKSRALWLEKMAPLLSEMYKLHPHWHRHPHYHQLHINFKSPTMPYSTLPVSVRRFHFWQLLPWVASYVQRLFTFTISFWHVQILRNGERRSRDWWNSKVLGACLGGPLWKSAPKQCNDIEDVWSIFQMHMELAAGWFTLRTRYISISKLLGLVLGHKSRNTNVWGWHQNGMPSQGWFEFGLSVVKTCKILGWFWLRCTTWTRTQCDADQTNPWWKPKNCHILQGSSYLAHIWPMTRMD